MTINTWDKFSETFEENNNYVVGIKDIEIAKDHLSSLVDTGYCLELGCGNGTYTPCLLKSASHIITTDLSENMVQTTKAKFSEHSNIQVEQADCFKLTYSDESFDTVFMVNLLHVIPTPDKALAECFRVLKKGGRVIILSFTLHNMTFLNQLCLKYRYVKTYGSKSASSITLTPQLAAQLAEQADFETIENKMIGSKVKAVFFAAVKPR